MLMLMLIKLRYRRVVHDVCEKEKNTAKELFTALQKSVSASAITTEQLKVDWQSKEENFMHQVGAL